MENFKQDILEELKEVEGKLNTAIIIVTSNFDANKKFPEKLMHKALKLKDVIKYFDYEYDVGFGGQECQSIYIFTKKAITFVEEYDGSTSLISVPRNPENYDYIKIIK